MREEMVTPVTARRLASAGCAWEPRIGDWCTVLGAEHVSEAPAGLWLVTGAWPQAAQVALVDASGNWPAARVAVRDCLLIPTMGQLKTWLRARGYRVATGEAPAPQLGASTATLRHVCRLTRPADAAPVDGEGANEAEALADAILRLLGAGTAAATPGGF
ncbi:MAG: hypothetical protein ACHQ4H_00465 [Ktedonobacterales bacterium]|jgi:hypothetical protein